MKKLITIILFILASMVGYSQTDGVNQDVIIGHSISYDAVSPVINDLDVVPLWMLNQTVAGALVHPECNAATTTNITLSGEQTIDNYSAVTGNRILVKDQTLPANNGVYIVGVPWTRATDLDSWAELYKSSVFIINGTLNSGSTYTSYMDLAGTLEVDTILYNKTGYQTVQDMSRYEIDSLKNKRNKVIIYTPLTTDSTEALFTESSPTETVTGLSLTGTGKVINGNLALSTTSGYSIPRTTELDSAKIAYEDKVNSLTVTGTSTKTITLTRQDGGTVTGTFHDADTAQNLSYNAITKELGISRGSGILLPLVTNQNAGLMREIDKVKLDALPDYYGNWTGTFDGQEGTYYLNYNNLVNKPAIPVISNTVYGSSWSTATTEGASKAALYAKIETLGTSSHTIGSHSDALFSSLANGNMIQYNGNKWINRTLSEAGIQPAGSYLSAIYGNTNASKYTITYVYYGGVSGRYDIPVVNSTIAGLMSINDKKKLDSLSTNILIIGSDSAYDATLWNGNKLAPSKNAIRDLWEAPIAATKIGGGLISDTEFNYLNNVTSNIQTQLNAKLGTSKLSNSTYNSVKWNGSDSLTTQDKIRDKLYLDSLAIANKHFMTQAYFSVISFDKSLRFLTMYDGATSGAYTVPKVSENNDGLMSPTMYASLTGKLDSSRVSTDLIYNRATWLNSNKVPTQKTITNKLYQDSLVWGQAARKVLGIESGAEKNVQADYTEEDTLSDAYIKHKPTYLSGNALAEDSSKFDIEGSGVNKIITAKEGINNLTISAENDTNQITIKSLGSATSTILRNISGTTEIINSNNDGLSIESFGNIGIKRYNSIIYTLPSGAGVSGQALLSNGPGGICYWGDVEGGTGGSGTVVSVGLSLPSDFNVSGSPVTNSGTLTAAWAVKPANTFLGATNGISGVPTFRTLVDDDIPNTITASNYLPLIGGTLTGKLTIPANTSTSAMLRITPFTSNPTSLSDGDIWTTASGVYARINGGTISLGNSGNTGLQTFTSSDTWGLYNGDITGKNPYPMVTINGLYTDTPELSDEIMFSDISSLTTPKKLYKTTLSVLKSLINTSVLTVRDIDHYTTIPTCTEIVFENAVVSQNGTVATITIPESSGGGGGTEAFQTLSSSGNVTWSWLTSKNAKIKYITGNVVLSLSEQANGQEGELWVYPDPNNDYTLTFPSGVFLFTDHSNVFNIDHGSYIWCFTMKFDGDNTVVRYGTGKN